MRLFLGVVLTALLLWAWAMKASLVRPAVGQRTPLVWASDKNPLRDAQIDLFNALNRSCALYLDPDNQSMDKVIVQSMGGVGPDIFDSRDAAQLSAYVRAGIAWDVTDALAERGIDVPRDAWPASKPLCVFEKRTYGVPTNIAPNVVWFHRDLFRKAGVPIPKTPWKWDAFIEIAKKLTKRGSPRDTQYGFLFDWWNWPHFVIGFGGSTFNKTGTRCTIDSPQCIAAVQLMHDLVYKHKVSPDPIEEAGLAGKGGWGSGTMNLFGAKRAAMGLGGRWWYVNLREFKNLELGVLESPYQNRRAFLAIARASCINRRSPRRNEALKFLVYLASPEYARLIDRQADGSPAFRRYAIHRNPADASDPDSHVWLDVARFAHAETASPYVDGAVVSRLINVQLDLVRIDAKTPERAMRDAAKAVNDAIHENLKNDPKLMARWLAAGGGQK